MSEVGRDLTRACSFGSPLRDVPAKEGLNTGVSGFHLTTSLPTSIVQAATHWSPSGDCRVKCVGKERARKIRLEFHVAGPKCQAKEFEPNSKGIREPQKAHNLVRLTYVQVCVGKEHVCA